MGSFENLSVKEIRRNLHQYPETGWTEFRTTALLAQELDRLGYKIYLGQDAVETDECYSRPGNDVIENAIQRAVEEDAPADYIETMGKYTGVVAEKQSQDDTGPTVGVRVDIDALEISESTDSDHDPTAWGFNSKYPGLMHACGHDGHTAIGIGIARYFQDLSNGGLKLFFQPAEEGVRGGRAMSATDHLSDIDYLIGLHLGLGYDTGTIIGALDRPFATTKLSALFEGESSHAANSPSQGRNAIQAAATCVQNIYGVPRHEDGRTRINVGRLRSDNPPNVVSDNVSMFVEVRGNNQQINDYMLDRVRDIVLHSGKMHRVDSSTTVQGWSPSFRADDEIAQVVTDTAGEHPEVENTHLRRRFNASDDASHFIRRVQKSGGNATYICIGASNPFAHHHPKFDINEEAINIGVDVVSGSITKLLTRS